MSDHISYEHVTVTVRRTTEERQVVEIPRGDIDADGETSLADLVANRIERHGWEPVED